MKAIVLLALVGLASCHHVFLRGDRDRDVKIEYSYDDDDDREVEVEINPSFRRVVTPVVHHPSTLQLVKFDAPTRPEVRTHFVEVEAPKPVFTQFIQPAPVVQVAAPAAPTPVVTQYIKREPERKTVFIQSQAVPVVPAPRPQFVTQYVQTKAVAVPRPVVARTSFVPVAPTQKVYSRPSFSTSFTPARKPVFRAYDDDSSEK